MKNTKSQQQADQEFLEDAFTQFKSLASQCETINHLCFDQFQDLINLNAVISSELAAAGTPQQFASVLYNGLVDQAEVMSGVMLTDWEEGIKLYQQGVTTAMESIGKLQTSGMKIFNFCMGLTPTPATIKLDNLVKANWNNSQQMASVLNQMVDHTCTQMKDQLQALKKKS